MTKSLVVAAVAIVGMSLMSSEAQAGRRCCRFNSGYYGGGNCCAAAPCCASSCCATSCCATSCCATAAPCCGAAPYAAPDAGPAAPQNAPAPPATTQSNGYQSYSYEPGPAPVVAPAYVRTYQVSDPQYDVLRGDKKFRAFIR